MTRVPHVLGILILMAAAIVFTAQAQEKELETPTLHQDIVPPEANEGRASTNMAGKSVFGAKPSEGQNPSAFANGEKILPRPPSLGEARGREPILGRPGFAADRDTQTQPDRQTGSDDTLQYVAVFNPSILPFKRMSAMDGVSPEFSLFTRDASALQEVSVGGAPTADRDLFWGSLMVDLVPGRDVPIPSLAPGMRVLSYEVEPRAALVFSKDGAENFYVRTDETGAKGAHRLVFMADASASYFAPKVPRYTVTQALKMAPPGIIKPLPANVQDFAQRAHQKLNLSPGMQLDKALDILTHYFRGFTPGELPESSENVYWDLFTNQVGVCRHRSYAFMITATGLGIPTRYVTNEAHAFVEVWVPTAEWVRIDLGGAALRMQVDNASDKSMYRPRGEDPFRSPPEYENNYTQLEGDIEGLSEEQREEGKQTRKVVDTEVGASQGFDPDAPEADAVDTAPRVGPGKGMAEVVESASSRKTKTYIKILDSAASAFRGSGLPVSGIMTTERDNDKTGVDGQRVDIFLVPISGDSDDAILVGTTVTKLDGTFSMVVTMPARVAVSDYYLYATSPGDATYGAVSSE